MASADQAPTSVPATVTSEVPAPVVTTYATLPPVTATATVGAATATVTLPPSTLVTTLPPVVQTVTEYPSDVTVTSTAAQVTVTTTVHGPAPTLVYETYGADPVSPMAPCTAEDGSDQGQAFPCLWDGATMGNGQGDTYVLTESL
jgi:hypothetical protein